MKRNLKQLGIYTLVFILVSYIFLPLGLRESIGVGLILGFFAGILNDIRTKLM
jgi:hypothetical protein